MDQLQDRADLPIWNAIEASNFKQALKLVDKRLLKKPTDYLEALKTYIRSHSPNVSEKTAVLLHIEEQAQRKKPVVDLSAIELYDDALDQVLGSSNDWARLMGEIRWQCVKAVPKNEELSLQNFKACLGRKDLDHARQIANSLEKSFPANREYIFWNLSMMFLFSRSQEYPANQTKLWGSLAFAQVSKLAAASKQTKAGDKFPVRSIQKPQELLLLHLITEIYGKPEQQLDYLNDSSLGPESAVAKGEWEIWRMRVRLMQEARRWTEVFDITGSLLKRARTKDAAGLLSEASLSDWVVWEAYIKSASEIGEPHNVEVEIAAQLDPTAGIDKSWRRNASLALVKLVFEDLGAFESLEADGAGSVSRKTVVFLKYLSDYGDASTAYSDLRPYAEKLNTEERKAILSHLEQDVPKLSSAKLITATVNNFKLKYLLICSLPEVERQQSPKIAAEKANFICISCERPCGYYCKVCLTTIGKRALESYTSALQENGEITKHLLITDQHPADDLCILAATCLIKLGLMDERQNTDFLSSNNSRCFLQAAALLEKAWLHSKPNFQLSLMLVRIYVYLGCGSLAMRAYQRLALKQIQLDTLSYTLFDRISTFHPRAFSSHAGEAASDKTPLMHLKRQQKVYKDAYEQIAKNIWLSFDKGNYNSMFQIYDVEKELSHGLGAAMSVVERRRITRLTEPGTIFSPVSDGYSLLAPHIEAPGTLSADNFDYKTFPNYESTLGTTFEELGRFAPAPSSQRFVSNLVTEKILLILSSSTASGEQEMLLAWLKQHLQSTSISKPKSAIRTTMTVPEEVAHQAYQAMAFLLVEASDKALWTEPDLTTRLETLSQDLSDAVEKMLHLVENMTAVLPAYFSTLHTLYTAYEFSKAVSSFGAWVARQGKKLHPEQAKLSKGSGESAKILANAVEKRCGVIKKGMDEGWIDKVLESACAEGTWLDEGDDGFMEEWAGEVVESWRESVAGLALLKA